MSTESLNNINILEGVNFEIKYVKIITIIMFTSAILLVCLILFGDMNNNYNNYIMFLVISIVDGCIFIDIVSHLIPQILIHLKKEE
jgi:hypothetical protein